MSVGRRCIVCGDLGRPAFERDGVVVVRSPTCGLEWQDPMPDEEALREIYDEGYFERWGGTDAAAMEEVRAMKRATYSVVFDEIRRFHSGGRLLDVGCALGFLLELAEELGFEPHGIDRNPEAARFAAARFGDRVRAVEIAPGLFEGALFDVVTLIDLLEHVTDPARLLGHCRDQLVEGGLLAIVLPNTRSLTRRLLGERWPHYVGEHLYHWSPYTLRRFLGAQGFDVVSVRTGFRKAFTGRYLATYAARVGSWVPPGIERLGTLPLRIPTGEMLFTARRN